MGPSLHTTTWRLARFLRSTSCAALRHCSAESLVLHQFCVFYTSHEESILREHFGVPQLQIHCALYLKVSDFLTVFTHGFFFSRHPCVLPACAAVRATNGSIDNVEAGKVPENVPVVRSIMGAPSTLMLYMCLHTNHEELIHRKHVHVSQLIQCAFYRCPSQISLPFAGRTHDMEPIPAHHAVVLPRVSHPGPRRHSSSICQSAERCNEGRDKTDKRSADAERAWCANALKKVAAEGSGHVKRGIHRELCGVPRSANFAE